jgi:hypothetical protein
MIQFSLSLDEQTLIIKFNVSSPCGQPEADFWSNASLKRGWIPTSGKNTSEDLIRRTFSGITISSIIGPRDCSGILLFGLQAEVAAIIFPPASAPDVGGLHARVRRYFGIR